MVVGVGEVFPKITLLFRDFPLEEGFYKPVLGVCDNN